MTDGPRAWDRDALELGSIGALASLEVEIEGLTLLLGEAPDWRPGKALLGQAAWLRGKLEELAASWQTRLVVAIVGPSGAGKSTLLNALAGAPLSATGLTRPTTRQVIAYTSDAAAAAPLRRSLQGAELRIETSARATALEYLTLLDTPDTNTLPENQELLARALGLADVILAVFAAQNPRLHDNLAFLQPFVERLPADNIIPVLNMVDRVPQRELDDVVADFREALTAEWGLAPERIYPISAKRSAPRAQFAPDETPINPLNEYPALETLVYSALNRAIQLADRRAARGERLLDLYRGRLLQALHDSAPARVLVEETLQELGHRVEASLQRTVAGAFAHVRGLDLNTTAYGLLGPRWWGPVGWLVGLWALILRIASFVSRPGRRRPSPLEQGLDHSSAEGDSISGTSLPTDEVAHLLATAWPPLADRMVAAGFSPEVRATSTWQERLDRAGEQMGSQIAVLYKQRLERLADRLAAWPLQLLLNLPVLGMLVWIGADAVLAFMQQRALPPTHFQTGAIALAAVWVLGYVLLQILVSLGLRRLRRRWTLRELGRGLAEALVEPWTRQLQVLRDLEARVGP